MSVLDEIQDGAQRAVAVAGPSVVRLPRGTGVVVADGMILTNAHNVHHEEVGVRFSDGHRDAATLAGIDLDGDLAILRIDTGDAPPISFADAPPETGAAVWAVTPSRHGPRVTFGTVSSTTQTFRGPRGRAIHDAVEHTAPLARGSSGSVVVDADGRMLGINTHRRGGFYLALPATEALRERIDRLAAGEVVERPRLGIAVTPPHVARRLREAVGLDDRDGVLVHGVGDDSPARRAGIERGDLIVAAGDATVAGSEDLFTVLDQLRPGASLELRLVRGAEERSVTVEFTDDA
jgi:serine protease Do